MSHFFRVLLSVILVFSISHPLLAASSDQDQEKRKSKSILEDILELPLKTSEGLISSVFSLTKVVITPTRTAQKADTLASAVSVFTKEELDLRGITTVKDALRKDTSVDFVQTGNSGPATIFLRGANSNHTRAMIDGVRVFDPISPNAAYDFNFLTLDNVRQIEVVKGPQSSLYGSDAIGGVVNVITQRGAGKPKVIAYTEAGSFQTYDTGASLNGEAWDWHFALAGSYFETKGISSAKRKLGNTETDPYDRQSYSARVDYDVSDDLNVGYIGRYLYANYEYDDSFDPLDDDNLKGWTRQMVSSVVLNHSIAENLEQKIQLSLTGNDRRDFDENDPAHLNDYQRDWYYGSTRQADWLATTRLWDVNTFLIGINYLKEKGEYYYYSVFGPAAADVSEAVFPKRVAESTGYFGEYHLNFNDTLSATLNTRIEDHSTAGTAETYKADGLYTAGPFGTKLKGSYGTGFKAPTIYQLYAVATPSEFGFGGFGGGNANLKSEESETYEFGIEQPLADKKFSAGVTYFHTDIENLIDAVYQGPPTFSTDQYKNVSQAETYGTEVPFRYLHSDQLQISGNYTWLHTKDKDTGARLVRRADNKANLDFNFVPFKRWNLNLDLSYVGSRLDSPSVKLKSYVKTDLKLSYDLSSHCNLYLRVDNLLNEKYEHSRNYGTTGTSAYAGVKAAF